MDDQRARQLNSFSADQRAEYDRLVGRLRAIGAEDAEGWALSEVAENIAQLARFLVLRRLWRWEIDTWGADTAWIQRMIGEAERDQTGFFADAGGALRRLRGLGATPEDLGRVARYVAYSSVFGTLN